jgi:hypothetical protein
VAAVLVLVALVVAVVVDTKRLLVLRYLLALQ